MRTHIILQFVFLLTLSLNARADYKFADFMKSLTSGKENVVTEIPDIEALSKAANFAEAQAISRGQTYPKMLLLESKTSAELSLDSIQELIAKKLTTIVIVPGLLGEFIETRAFEEVFERNSTFKTQWSELMKKNSVTDLRFNLEKNGFDQVHLSELIDAASIDDSSGKPLVKLIILKTKLGSLESIGDNAEKSIVFNRRLQKYFELVQDQNIVMLGYSRGTPLALEMITQAEKSKLSYLGNVKAVVSHAGVVMGSSLADVTDDQNAESGRLFIAAKKLLSQLGTSNGILGRPYQFAKNSAAISEFLLALGLNSSFDPNSILKSAMSGDFRTTSMLIVKVTSELGLNLRSITDFNGRVVRVKKFISEILSSVDGLKTRNALVWWQTHTLPRNIKYLSISAAMVDPAKSSLEKQIYDSKVGYNETLDDDSLQENRRTYEKATGFALNDSQVALHQSQFLPKVIESLNPANAGLHIESLGLLQTHHWGVSLRVVNVMRDGRVNPFPREKILLSLAAYLNQ
jgi:hypothetical protein